ncbi:uncharacterized protein LOC106643084 [Copidosoma floridanum]|uniref:uncharacterized protein LOC106643084 n=1 Tax=Copidosoma floridanum TaxID=29053 RepID=UPI0006C97F72|nr:uncharacterized protein LOC106643084 [Copidosoma floridanum]
MIQQLSPIKQYSIVCLYLSLVLSMNARSLKAGRRRQDDGQLCHGEFSLDAQPGKTAQMWTTCEVSKPEQFITHVLVIDRVCPDRGGYAHIYKGGICQKTVSINMISPRNNPLNFSVYVFATPAC